MFVRQKYAKISKTRRTNFEQIGGNEMSDNNLIELFENFSDKIFATIEEMKTKEFGFASKEMLSILVSTCLIEDISNVIKFKELGYPSRYTDAMIRNMCEQIIEYIYIMKNQDLIDQYFGENLEEELHEQDINPFEALRRTGSARFNLRRKSVKSMAIEINEGDTTDEKISLYTIFGNKAELEHNSYFNNIFDIIGEIEKEEPSDLDDIFISHIMAAFLTTFNGSELI